MAELDAVVYLADGIECRWLCFSKSSTVRDLVERMLQVQDDWDAVGALVPGGRAKKEADEAGDSTTDDTVGDYALVEVRKLPSGIVAQRILPLSLPLKDRDLLDVRRHWDSLRRQRLRKHVQEHFKEKKESGPKKASKLQLDSSDFWFVNPSAGKLAEVRVKLIDTKDYRVVRSKQGWLDVKEKGKTRNLWVVYRENVLTCFEDADETVVVQSIPDVDDCEFKFKSGKKGAMTLRLKRYKTKLDLICETELMANRWFEALRQGVSGVIQHEAPTGRTARVLQLKSSVVEDIPEYTEEEELADLEEALSLKKIQNDPSDGGYLSMDESQPKPWEDADVDYLTAIEASDLRLNDEGDYLTLSSMRRLAEDAGYLSVDEMKRLANSEGDYLTLETAQQLARDAGYLTLNEMQSLVKE